MDGSGGRPWLQQRREIERGVVHLIVVLFNNRLNGLFVVGNMLHPEVPPEPGRRETAAGLTDEVVDLSRLHPGDGVAEVVQTTGLHVDFPFAIQCQKSALPEQERLFRNLRQHHHGAELLGGDEASRACGILGHPDENLGSGLLSHPQRHAGFHGRGIGHDDPLEGKFRRLSNDFGGHIFRRPGNEVVIFVSGFRREFPSLHGLHQSSRLRRDTELDQDGLFGIARRGFAEDALG